MRWLQTNLSTYLRQRFWILQALKEMKFLCCDSDDDTNEQERNHEQIDDDEWEDCNIICLLV